MTKNQTIAVESTKQSPIMPDELTPETENNEMDRLKSDPPRSIETKPNITGQIWSQWFVMVIISLLSPIILAKFTADQNAKQAQWMVEQSDRQTLIKQTQSNNQAQWMIKQSEAQAKKLAEYNLDIWREQKQMDLDQKNFEQHLAALRDFNKSFVEFQIEIRNLIHIRIRAKCGEFLIASGVNVTNQEAVRNDFRQRLLRMEIASKELVLNYGIIAPTIDMDVSRLESLCKELTKIGNTELTEATKLKLKKLSKSPKSEYEKGIELDSIEENEAVTRSLKGIDTALKEFGAEIQKKLLTVPKDFE